jgi:pyruvate dehydrogenase E2 component (dihydrolipoamide acetyltransferase)
MGLTDRIAASAKPTRPPAGQAPLLFFRGRKMTDVNMPKLSDTMEEGTIVEWKKKTGDEVKAGDVIAEVESDKATFDLEAESGGVLSILVEQGVPAKIGAPIATIGEASAAPAKAKAAPPAAAKPKEPEPAEPEPEASSPPPAEPPKKVDAKKVDEEEPDERAPDGPSPDGKGDGLIKASPLAKRLATEMGVDLASLKGSGPDGRIVKEDVLAAAGTARPAERRRPEAAPRAPGPDVEVVEPSRMQATIARRMAEAKSTVPEFTVTVEARVDEAVSMRQQLKDSVPGADKVTMTDMLVRACALALRKFPEVNSSWVDGRFQRKRAINIGLAVAPSQGMGLLVPVVHDADAKDLIQISIESRQVIERARSGRPSEGDLSGATFSISNLGMFGVDEFVAIINPPEAAILAVGAIKDVPVVEEGRIVPGKVMRMTLSVDHRVFYGATAAQFMAEVKRLIENPVTLVVPPTR